MSPLYTSCSKSLQYFVQPNSTSGRTNSESSVQRDSEVRHPRPPGRNTCVQTASWTRFVRPLVRYAVGFATAGSEHTMMFWPLVLHDIASSKRRMEHRMGLRLLRRDAAAVNTPWAKDSNSLFFRVRRRILERGGFSPEQSTIHAATHISRLSSLSLFTFNLLQGTKSLKSRIRLFNTTLKR